MVKVTVCYKCVPPERYIGCHDRCPKFLEQKSNEKIKELDRRIRCERDADCYFFDTVNRNKKSQHKIGG